MNDCFFTAEIAETAEAIKSKVKVQKSRLFIGLLPYFAFHLNSTQVTLGLLGF
jgi:hypothetical protein